jgi:serine/threonine protein kinase
MAYESAAVYITRLTLANLVEGLAYLRELRVAHLDIKPSSIVYTDNVRLHVIGFGTVVRVGLEDEIVEGVYGSRR